MSLVDTQQDICEYIHGHNTGTTRLLDQLENENKWDAD